MLMKMEKEMQEIGGVWWKEKRTQGKFTITSRNHGGGGGHPGWRSEWMFQGRM
jgi:hypothetical protein